MVQAIAWQNCAEKSFKFLKVPKLIQNLLMYKNNSELCIDGFQIIISLVKHSVFGPL